MRLVQSSDREALSLLFDRYSCRVLNVATRILRDPTEAQDLVQEVFLYIPKEQNLRTIERNGRVLDDSSDVFEDVQSP
jgi:DNA-directed RNA polymerase specialized sigma24 family protein